METAPASDLAAEPPRAPALGVASSTGEGPRRPAAPPTPTLASPPVVTEKAIDDLTPSPHDQPLASEPELRRSERLCIRDVPDDCVRVADAFAAGRIVPHEPKRASQYRNLAFKGYIRLCESNQPEACYALARMYLYGDGVPANPAYAKNLMRRVVEVCRYKDAAICTKLVQEAPMPPKRSR